MSKKKKKSTNANKTKIPKKKPVKKLPIIIGSVFAVAIIAVIVVAVVKNISEKNHLSELYDYTWIPESAQNASGDEVEMAEVYNTDYTSYQGSLTFSDDGTFSIWLSPGSPDDGTHSGVYQLTDEKTIDVVFDEGTYTSFKIKRNGDDIENIVVNYNDYEIYFSKQ